MNVWQTWMQEIASRLSEAVGETVEASEIVVPPDTTLGDFAYGTFRLAKARKMNPAELAKEIASGFSIEGSLVESVTAAGPYVNFRLNAGQTVAQVIEDIHESGDAYGSCDLGKQQQLLLEYAQPNTHKEIHVGHLRNLVLGVALDRLLRRANWQVEALSYHGDVGAHVAKCLWWMVRSRNTQNASHDMTFLGRMYMEANQELEVHPELKEEVSSVQQKLEAHDPVWEKLWLETREWSLKEMERIFDGLGVRVDRPYLESEVVDRGQQIVDELLAKGVAKESQGAIVVDLEEMKLGVFLIRKSDGTSLYATKDLALAELKLKEYPQAARSLILVDNRQTLYFKQLFETLRRLQMTPVPEMVGYEFVTLKTGAMASREGNVVTLASFQDEVMAYARHEVQTRHSEWASEKVEEIAGAIAQAGIKFGMLKQDGDKVFVFDLEQALSFDGATGPYCQYAVTRLAAIIKKSQRSEVKGQRLRNETGSVESAEKTLALTLAQFPLRVEQAARELRPSVMAHWCIEAAQAVNAFYRDVPVLGSEGAILASRLQLVAAAQSVLSQGLALLGIPSPSEM